MGIREFARQMKVEVESLKQQGVAAIYVDNLINYLTVVEQSDEPDPSPADMERYKAELEQNLEMMKHENDARLEIFKTVIVSGQNAVRSIILINGGASVAMLAFLGHLARIGSSEIAVYANCLLPFVLGTLLGGLTSGGTYLTQFVGASHDPKLMPWAHGLNYFVILLGLTAFGFFGWGAWQTYSAFITLPPVGNPAFIQTTSE